MDVRHLAMVSDEPTKAIAGYHMTQNLDLGDPAFHAFVQDPKNAQRWHEYYQKEWALEKERLAKLKGTADAIEEEKQEAQKFAADTEC